MSRVLNARTRQVVTALLGGTAVVIAEKTVGPLSTDEMRLLRLLAESGPAWEAERGGELARTAVAAFGAETAPQTPPAADPAPAAPAVRWRLLTLRACSFRGLAPAGIVWEHSFAQRSHLFYGPNGSGKSSLLGALVWCLTGRILRDDQPPSPPDEVPVYTDARRPTVAGSRVDALTLTDHTGAHTAFDHEYWVALEFLTEGTGGGPRTRWLRRHSSAGLAISEDGAAWTAAEGLDALGISQLDVELHVLMLSRIPHLRFGKDADLVHLFSQVVGLDDLEGIAELAGKVHAAVTREATALEQRSLSPAQQRAGELAVQIAREAPDAARGTRTYAAALVEGRSVEAVRAFEADVTALIEQSKAQLARDLGLELSDAPDRQPELQQTLDNLPGNVQSATDELARPLAALFPDSIGLRLPAPEDLAGLRERLETFERTARLQARQRLEWGVRAARDARAPLLLEAAGSFADGMESCPVCGQDLGAVPAVREELALLRPLADQLHLRRTMQDLELNLLASLESIVTAQFRQASERDSATRIREDWERLKRRCFPGLLAGVAATYDAAIAGLDRLVRADAAVDGPALAEGFEVLFPGAFSRLDAALLEARRFVRFVSGWHGGCDGLCTALTRLLQGAEQGGQGDSLRAVLLRGRAANERLHRLEALRQTVSQLGQAEQERHDATTRVADYRRVAAACEGPKSLAQPVRQEVFDVMKSVEPRMKDYYQRLYGDDRLPLDMVTTGRAANPRVKNELNVYLKAGSQRVPSGPFANAGRLRALALCFVFALLERSPGTLTILILDDPALSLDDDHKSRLLDHLVRPFLHRHQILLATHYETFFKLAEPVFQDAERLQLVPRRTAADAVAFEPADLLQRFEETLNAASCTWREAGVNLRRWVERALHALSAYCPEPFVVFNNIPDSVNAYERSRDQRIATPRRDRIVAALRSPAFSRIMHRVAHDEEPTEVEARDGLACLKACRKEVDAEIARYKELFQHDLLGRAIVLFRFQT